MKAKIPQVTISKYLWNSVSTSASIKSLLYKKEGPGEPNLGKRGRIVENTTVKFLVWVEEQAKLVQESPIHFAMKKAEVLAGFCRVRLIKMLFDFKWSFKFCLPFVTLEGAPEKGNKLWRNELAMSQNKSGRSPMFHFEFSSIRSLVGFLAKFKLYCSDKSVGTVYFLKSCRFPGNDYSKGV